MPRRLSFAILLGSLAAACAPMAAKESAAPSGQPAYLTGADGKVDRRALQRALLDNVDASVDELDRATRAITAPDVEREAQRLRLHVVTTLAEQASSGEPETAIIEIVTFTHLQRQATANWLAGRSADAPEQALGTAMVTVDERMRAIASGIMTPAQWTGLNERLATTAATPTESGMLAATDFDRADIRTLAPAARIPATGEAREREEASLLNDRLAFTLGHLPSLVRWQADEIVDRSLVRPEVQRTFDEIASGHASIDRLTTALDAARLAAVAIEERVASVNPDDLSAAKELASEIRGTINDAEEALPPAGRAITDLRDAMASAERVTASLRDLSTGPDGKPLDLSSIGAASERFATAAADLRSAIQQANQLLASDESTKRLQDFAATGRASVDHLTFRIALLMVVAASLTIVVMVVRSLTRPRAEPTPRVPRR